ncbi:MAG: NADAR family protein [Lachnospiraceae bacterium]|nr:NADAR family protein [Lachnospiraceae bacterium]
MLAFYNYCNELRQFLPDYEKHFDVDGKNFTSLTQYLEYSKAKVFGDEKTAWSIYLANDAAEARNRAKNIAGFDETRWHASIGAALYRALMGRVKERPEDILALLKTGDETLVFCNSPDEWLGIRQGSSDPDVQDMTKWKGHNLLGFLLMEVREYYRKLTPEAAAFDWKPKIYGGPERKYQKPWDFPPYEGKESYVYLSFALRDYETAQKLGNILRKMNCNVRYDPNLVTGRIWTGERAKAIEDCMAVIELSTQDECTHLELAARNFAELLEIPLLTVDINCVAEEDEDLEVRCRLEDKDFSERLEKQIELVKRMYEERKAKSPAEKQYHDMLVSYKTKLEYSSFGLFRSTAPIHWCNLRTREVLDTDGKQVKGKERHEVVNGRWTYLNPYPARVTDQALYRILIWMARDYKLVSVTDEEDYFGTPEDWKFTICLADNEAEINEETDNEFRKFKRAAEQARADYPFMDEFEYLNTGGEDE